MCSSPGTAIALGAKFVAADNAYRRGAVKLRDELEIADKSEKEECSLMSFHGSSVTSAPRCLIAGLSIAAFLLITGAPNLITAQETKQAGEATKSSGNAALIAPRCPVFR